MMKSCKQEGFLKWAQAFCSGIILAMLSLAPVAGFGMSDPGEVPLHCSFHNHTNMSDGKFSLEAMTTEAQRIGFTEFGISDHYSLAPAPLKVSWSMKEDFLPEYFRKLQSASGALNGLSLRFGLEADYFPETADRLKQILKDFPLDYVIGSVHYIGSFPLDESADFWKKLSVQECDEMWKTYWVRIRQMAETGCFDIVGHIDLPKKFGFRPSVDLTSEIHSALVAIKNAGMVMEINTAGWSYPAHEAYPSIELLKKAHELGIPVMINSDAHNPKHLKRSFRQALLWVRLAGFSDVVRFEKRKQIKVPLTGSN